MPDGADSSLPFPVRTELRDRYGIRPSAVTVLQGGYWNDVFALQGERGALVVRISHPSATERGVDQEHRLMDHVHRVFPEVPLPVRADDGSTCFVHEGRVVSVFPLMPGRTLDRSRAEHRRDAARWLARMHGVALAYPGSLDRPGYVPVRALDWDRNRMWSWPLVEALLHGDPAAVTVALERLDGRRRATARTLLSHGRAIMQARDEFRDWVGELAQGGRRLVQGPIHGDFWANNLLCTEGGITAVLDWEDCQREWLVWELARATWEFCKAERGDTLDFTRAHGFVRTYHEAGGPVPSREFDLILPLIRCVRLVEILSALHNALAGEHWDPAYAAHNLRSLARLSKSPVKILGRME